MSKLIVVTASGLSREVLASIEASGEYDVIGFLDDKPDLFATKISGPPVLGSIADAAGFSDTAFIVSAGQGQIRQQIVDRLAAHGVDDDRYATIIDPTVPLPHTSSVGAGSIILAECVLTADVLVGRHVVAMPHVTLTHDDQINGFAKLCAGVTLGGDVDVERAANLGINASVRMASDLGKLAVVAAAAGIYFVIMVRTVAALLPILASLFRMRTLSWPGPLSGTGAVQPDSKHARREHSGYLEEKRDAR